MAEVRWTPQATEDLESIANYIAYDSPQYAHLFAIDVFAAVERLQDFPEIGRMLPETKSPNIREIILGNFRIVYRIKRDIIELLTIHHGAKLMDIEKLK